MTLEAPIVRSDATAKSTGRWGQLACGVVCMVMIPNLQYGWTLFVGPIDQISLGRPRFRSHSASLCDETWLVPVEGWLVDRFGPRVVVAFGGTLVAVALGDQSSQALFRSLCRRRDRRRRCGRCLRHLRRQCAEVVSRQARPSGRLDSRRLRRGSGATVIPIRNVIGYGYEAAFMWFGLGQGLVVLALSQLLAHRSQPKRQNRQTRLTHTSRVRALRNGQVAVFWVLYTMFVLVAAAGLTATRKSRRSPSI